MDIAVAVTVAFRAGAVTKYVLEELTAGETTPPFTTSDAPEDDK